MTLEVILRSPWAGPWRAFRDPLAVLTATRADDVRTCLEEVDRAVARDGCYAAGFVTYEAAAGFGLPVHPPQSDGLPLVCFGLYAPDRVTSQPRPRPAGPYETGPWIPSIDRAAYVDAV